MSKLTRGPTAVIGLIEAAIYDWCFHAMHSGKKGKIFPAQPVPPFTITRQTLVCKDFAQRKERERERKEEQKSTAMTNELVIFFNHCYIAHLASSS
jgi:hypothetical protein